MSAVTSSYDSALAQLMNYGSASTMSHADAAFLEEYFDRLWPICRSIMGPGFRHSLDIIGEQVELERLRFKSGQAILDWIVPNEWSIRDAYIVDPAGNKRAEFTKSNLHVMNYSAPFRGRLSLSELKSHLYTHPDLRQAIPYLTTYYKERWGFCISQDEFDSLPAGEYEAVVDTELKPGELVVGEAFLPGTSTREVMFSTYLCHPSLANNELSGPLVAMLLYRRLEAKRDRRLGVRFVFAAETIGSIAYLSVRGGELKARLDAGFQITCVGDGGPFTYKRCREPGQLTDRTAELVLRERGAAHTFREYDPGDGSDERQWSSPGFNLPVGSLMRTMYGEYPEYHSSLDDKSLMRFDAMVELVDTYEQIYDAINVNRTYLNLKPHGEPNLGRRGLYPTLGVTGQRELEHKAILWVLNLSDGKHDLLEIARLGRLPLSVVAEAAHKLEIAALLCPQADA